jgi:hypothetical protein
MWIRDQTFEGGMRNGTESTDHPTCPGRETKYDVTAREKAGRDVRGVGKKQAGEGECGTEGKNSIKQ